MQGPSLELKDSVVRAGAGTGKTTGLVDKVVEIYRVAQTRGLPAPRIVLTTFTRKATQELKERLIKRACKERDPRLLQFVSDPGHLFISTIHGLLNTFLKQVGHLAGLDSGLQIINPGEAEHLARVALRQVLIDEPAHLEWLEIYGFERVLEMSRRFDALLREQNGLVPGTLAELKEIKLREQKIWHESLKQLIADIQSETAGEAAWEKYTAGLRAVLNGTGEFERKPSRSKNTGHLDALHDHVDEIVKGYKKEMEKSCWNEEFWPQIAQAWKRFEPFARAFNKAFDGLKQTQGRFEMADLELKTLEVLREKPFVASVFSEGWDFWMIDEYQDTSPVQVELLTQLIGGKPKYIVGDPQQSIYLFRGAEVGVFKDAEKAVIESGGERRELMKNYRSRPELLLWINDFMASISSSFSTMEPKAAPENIGHPAVQLIRAQDSLTEAEAIAARVGELVSGGAALEQICVLGRTHRNLMQISRVLKKYGFPTHVHSSQGFQSRREVLDARALWKFLVNPHDNLNLMIVLRSPWFFTADWQLAEWMQDRPASLWRKLAGLETAPDSIARLKAAQTQVLATGVVRAFEETLKAAAFLDLCLVNDSAGRKESNLWKLILKARALEKEGGQSILDLLGEADEDPLESNDGDATSAQEPNSINLMTIHGSKGLEFDHILLPGAGESQRDPRVPSLDASGGRYFFPVWIDSESEFINSPLDYVAQKRRAGRESEEFDRWLYVALTRAKQTLTLASHEPKAESWAGRAPWFNQEPGVHKKETYAYEIRLAETMTAQPYVAALKPATAPRPLWSKVEEASETRRSVTDMITQGKSERIEARELLSDWQARTTGTRLHRVFEGLKFNPETQADPGDAVTAKALKYVLSLKTPPLMEIIREGHPEWGFQVATAKGIVEGQIDLWAEHDGRVYVIDYKTGSPKYSEQAFRQLGLYAWALRKFGHAVPIELLVIYPLSEKIERREFNEKLFADWERELGGPKA